MRRKLLDVAVVAILFALGVPTAPALEPNTIFAPSDAPPEVGTSFGGSVALQDDYLVVGASGDPWYDGINTGAVYVFRRASRAWIEQAKLSGSATGFHAQLGASVDIDGDVIVAGAPKWEFGT